MASTDHTGFKSNASLCTLQLAGQVDLLKLCHQFPKRYPHLLESVSHNAFHHAEVSIGRYSFLFAFPQETILCQSVAEAQAFIAQFEQAQQAIACAFIDSPVPFKGGWFAYFAYDYAQVVEPVLQLPQSDKPLAILQRIPAAVVVDHAREVTWLIAEPDQANCISQMQQDIAQLLSEPLSLSKFEVVSASEQPEQHFLDGVEAIKAYILAGDVFQVNLSRQWDISLANATPLAVYAALRQHNPAPFAAYCDFDTWQIISSSPERLVSFDGDWVQTRPIAGTRKRSADMAADQALIAELIAHPKERAEHIMLIDLERNDLGRICQPGTVAVNELMVVESYEHVHHIVSNVRGKLQSHLTPLQVLHAVFPGGTITGCPKIRCMEIIAQLEQMPRQAYTGSLGYINRDGTLDFNILIRTLEQTGQQVHFRAGAGIVADSIAIKELEETRHKAKGLLNALG